MTRCPRDRRTPGDGRAAGGLAADEADVAWRDPAQLDQLLERAGDAGDHRARRDRGHDDVGEPPAERLGDLVGERLAALGVVRAEVDVDRAPAELVGDLEAQAVDVVVGAVDRDDRRAVGERMLDLRRLEVGRHEHVRGQARGRRGRRGRAREVAGARAGERIEPEGERLRRRDRDRAVLEREGRVARVVLDQERVDAEGLAQAAGRDDRRAADGKAADRRIDREQLAVAPDARRPGGEDRRRDRRPNGVEVIRDLERAETGRTDVVEARCPPVGRSRDRRGRSRWVWGWCRCWSPLRAAPSRSSSEVLTRTLGGSGDRRWKDPSTRGRVQGGTPYLAGGPARNWHLAGRRR